MKKRYYAKSKLNLYLYVGKKEEILHNIDSLMIRSLVVSDIFYVQKSKKFSYESSIRIDCDIVPQIINFMETRYKLPFNFHIKVKKNIPLSSGLGGESACGAMAINLYQKMVLPNMTMSEKEEIAQKFGSDIIYCLRDEPCYVSETGNKIEKTFFNHKQPISVICFKNIANKTADFFKCLPDDKKIIPKEKQFGYNAFLESNLQNEHFKRVYNLLHSLGYHFNLTGTGPTLFYIKKLTKFQLEQIRKVCKDNGLLFFHRKKIW